MDHEEIDLDGLLPQDKKSTQRRRDIASELEYLSGDSYYDEHVGSRSSDSVIDTGFLKSREKAQKKKESKKKKGSIGESDWFSELMDDVSEAEAGTKVRAKHSVDFDDLFGGGKKKKKKKKKKGEPTDFKKEFETENALYTNILRDTTRFVDSLQREYDSLSGKKGSGRGTTKNEQDLIANIISARQLATNIVDKKVNLKKLTTELAFKERKELGLDAADSADMGLHSASYLKQLIDNRQMLYTNGSDEIMDVDDEDVDSFLDESIDRPVSEEEIALFGESDRTEEADLYLKYENSNVTTYVSINKADTSDYYYFAMDEDGNDVPDYPLPKSRITSTNRSTGFATDEFGQKYPIDWR